MALPSRHYWLHAGSSQAQQQTQPCSPPGTTQPRGQGACKEPPDPQSKPSHHLLNCTGVTLLTIPRDRTISHMALPPLRSLVSGDARGLWQSR